MPRAAPTYSDSPVAPFKGSMLDAMDLALNTAAVAVVAYGLADASETLPVFSTV